MNSRQRIVLLTAAIFAALAMVTFDARTASAQTPAAQTAGTQKTVWYFYRVKWGFQDEP